MIRSVVLLVLAALALGACAGGEKIESIYVISAPSAPSAGGATSAQVLVPEPRAVAALSSNRVAVKPTDLTLAYYPSVALQDTVPKVVQRVLLETFQNSGKIHAVGLPGESLLINYQVVTQVRAFQAETFAGDQARVELFVKLLNDTNGRVVANRLFEASVPLKGDTAEDAAVGLNRAAQLVAEDVLAWMLSRI